jgi:hypothetical protein
MNTYWGRNLCPTQTLKAGTHIATDGQLNTSAKLNSHTNKGVLHFRVFTCNIL